MAIRKKKDDKLAVRPTDSKAEITNLRPFDLWSEMDRMLDNFRTDFDELFWPWQQRTQPVTTMTNRRIPPLDVADLGDHYEMKLELPGVAKEDINIEVTSNTVEISTQHNEEKEEKDKNWLRRERSITSYYRALELPEELRTDNIDAELKDGVLLVKLPKVEPKPQEKPKKIRIK